MFRRLTASEDFRNYAEHNQWDASYRSAEDSRKFMAEQYEELKGVMTYLGLVKKP